MLKLDMYHQVKNPLVALVFSLIFICFTLVIILFTSSAIAKEQEKENVKANKIVQPKVVNGKKKDSEYPTEIFSDTAEFDDKSGSAIYTGKVRAEQGSRRLWSDVLTIYRGNDNKISKMIAKSKDGNLARIKAQPNPEKPVGNGKAKIIKYFPNEDKALLIGKAELEQGGDIIRGEELIYYPEKELLVSKSVANSRTSVILQPRNKDKTTK